MRCLDRSDRAAPVVVPAQTSDEDERAERVVRCVECDHPVAHDRDRVEVDGRHDHVFTNPHGYTFHIACFGDAFGATEAGEPSAEWAWFVGTEWRLAVCGGCFAHLGWSFRGDTRQFWGFVVQRIR